MHKHKRETVGSAQGAALTWIFGGALIVGLLMISGLLVLVLINGVTAFYPRPISNLVLTSGEIVVGELVRSEDYIPEDGATGRSERRTLYRIGNFDLGGTDFRWIPDGTVAQATKPADLWLIERTSWGVFIGYIQSLNLDGMIITDTTAIDRVFSGAQSEAAKRRVAIRTVGEKNIGAVSASIDKLRLAKLASMPDVAGSGPRQIAESAGADIQLQLAALQQTHERLVAEVDRLKADDDKYRIHLIDGKGQQLDLPISALVRAYRANDLSLLQKLLVYGDRWWEFLSADPREANTEGGIFPALFGTFAMTILLSVLVTPFGVMAALYLREYARQGLFVAILRIGVNNLAGVPSIVYGVFGLGFFAYVLGAGIDRLFFSEKLPNPTFGTGGLLWASLTLALLTLPVVIVATEEAIAAVPRSMREGSLACGATRWQTIRHIILPRAMPGILTGLMLAMARGAGEVAPLMLVGVVKYAPELPVDANFPYIHFERSFMHLAFHIFDVGFQSRNAEAGKPLVFAATLVLIALVFAMNLAAIVLRGRLKRKFIGGHF